MTLAPDHLGDLAGVDLAALEDLACRADLGVFSQRRLGYEMAPFHMEWTSLAQTESRLALLAPREHAKSQTFTINATTWRSVYVPGIWTFMFAQTLDQAKDLLARTKAVIESVDPELVAGADTDNAVELTLANGARIDVAGAGKRVRGKHPDVIIGDDVLDDEGTATAHQRRKTARWWFGTVTNMAHPGTQRVAKVWGQTVRIKMPPTVVQLVGTPFHSDDLLMGMKGNPRYAYYRYAAECPPDLLVPGTHAVEVARG